MSRPSDRKGSRVARGRLGESIAAHYLEVLGYRILGRNRRVGPLELDLLAEEKREFVVVEVRLRSGREHGLAEETVDRRKRARLVSAGRRVWEEEERRGLGLRFDLVAITLLPRGLVLRHHRHFLDPGGMGLGG